MKNAHKILIFSILVFFGCKNSTVYEQYKSFENESWNKDTVINFNFNIEDSLKIYTLYVNTRNTGDYEFSNLILFVKTELPGNIKMQDTLDCILADKKGKWLGSGFGSLYSNKIRYKYHVRFPKSGEYHIEIKHGMRKTNLNGISDIGLELEKNN